MKKINNFIKSLNFVQKVGLFFGFSACLVLFFLHNPIQGYAGNCALYIFEDAGYHPVILSSEMVDHWYECVSNKAIIPLFGNVSVWLFSELIMIAITVFWVWIFKDNK